MLSGIIQTDVALNPDVCYVSGLKQVPYPLEPQCHQLSMGTTTPFVGLLEGLGVM